MIGIIGAMDVEVNTLKQKVKNKTVTNIAGIDFVMGDIEGVMAVVAQCSPGKVNAALCTQAMIDRFSPDCIINVGVGCSLSPEVVIKNIVIASDVCEYDIDITALGEPRGFINGLNMTKVPTDGEMEGGAIGHTCAANGIPFAVLRSISDGGDENALMDYPTFKNIAAKLSTSIILEYITAQRTQLELF